MPEICRFYGIIITPRRALNLVYEWLDQHKDELMANWHRMENGETLATINPLD